MSSEFEVSDDLSQAITDWSYAEGQRSHWVAREAALRKRITGEVFPLEEPGTHKVRLPYGMALRAEFRVNYSVDKEALEEYRTDGTVATILKKVIFYKPDLVVKEWNSLTTDDKAKVANLVTEKGGMPKLELLPQSKIRW